MVTAPTLQKAISRPSKAPSTDNRTLSIGNCRIIRHRLAPRAVRMAISFCRSDALAERQALEDRPLLLPIQKCVGRNRVSPARSRGFPHLHKLARFFVRQRLQQDTIDNTEDGRVRPDAERERYHSHGSEAGILQRLAESKFQIVHGEIGKHRTLNIEQRRSSESPERPQRPSSPWPRRLDQGCETESNAPADLHQAKAGPPGFG